MVRLKVITATIHMAVNKYFNSTMVRLKVGFHKSDLTDLSHFNSTMVRLKAKMQSWILPYTEFQFHYGTIKSEIASRY